MRAAFGAVRCRAPRHPHLPTLRAVVQVDEAIVAGPNPGTSDERTTGPGTIGRRRLLTGVAGWGKLAG